MKSTKTKFEQIDLKDLKKILPEAALDGHNKRASDAPGKFTSKKKPNRGKRKA